LLRFICLKRLQENNEYCSDFEVRFCCEKNYLDREDETKSKTVKREALYLQSDDLIHISRNIHDKFKSELVFLIQR